MSHCLVLVGQLKVRDQKHDRAAEGHLVCKVQRTDDISSPRVRLKEEDLTYDSEDVLTPFLGRNVLFYLVAKKDQANLVAVPNRRESKHTSQLGGHLALALRARPEVAGGAHIYHQQDGQLALLCE